MALLPVAATPLLITADSVSLLVIFPFLMVAWMAVSLRRGREPKRQVWLYAFSGGFMLLDDPPPGTPAVPWSQVTEVSEVWGESWRFGDEGDSAPVLKAYRLRSSDGRVHEISRSFRNVQDPYGEVGQFFRGLAPGTVGKTMPKVPTIDEIITTYTPYPGGQNA